MRLLEVAFLECKPNVAIATQNSTGPCGVSEIVSGFSSGRLGDELAWLAFVRWVWRDRVDHNDLPERVAQVQRA